jgi:hypothetical protein
VEAVPEFKHSGNLPLISLVSLLDGYITHLSKAKRGKQAATKLSRFYMDSVLELTPPLKISDVTELLPAKYKPYASKYFTEGGKLPPKSFLLVVDIIRKLSPESHSLLDRFSVERRELIAKIRPSIRQNLAYQKDTVGVALALAEIDREDLQQWEPPKAVVEGSGGSFLDGLKSVRLREDPMIINDMNKVPGYEYVKDVAISAALFENGNTRLTIILANRLPLEEQTGGDLIYYNETFKCFVIIQYKAMEHDGNGNPHFRFPNDQLTEEISRMKNLLIHLSNSDGDTETDSFRLHKNPFFLKFCPRVVLEPDSKSITPGMYVPLEFWERLENDPTMVGPRGGSQLNYQNVKRYINNSEFFPLVTKAWVGTSVSQSHLLEGIIREVIESGRTVTLAVKSDIGPRPEYPAAA